MAATPPALLLSWSSGKDSAWTLHVLRQQGAFEADPCGENGEFHTFVHDGPMFRRPIGVRAGELVTRDGFVYADLLPTTTPDPEETPQC